MDPLKIAAISISAVDRLDKARKRVSRWLGRAPTQSVNPNVDIEPPSAQPKLSVRPELDPRTGSDRGHDSDELLADHGSVAGLSPCVTPLPLQFGRNPSPLDYDSKDSLDSFRPSSRRSVRSENVVISNRASQETSTINADWKAMLTDINAQKQRQSNTDDAADGSVSNSSSFQRGPSPASPYVATDDEEPIDWAERATWTDDDIASRLDDLDESLSNTLDFDYTHEPFQAGPQPGSISPADASFQRGPSPASPYVATDDEEPIDWAERATWTDNDIASRSDDLDESLSNTLDFDYTHEPFQAGPQPGSTSPADEYHLHPFSPNIVRHRIPFVSTEAPHEEVVPDLELQEIQPPANNQPNHDDDTRIIIRGPQTPVIEQNLPVVRAPSIPNEPKNLSKLVLLLRFYRRVPCVAWLSVLSLFIVMSLTTSVCVAVLQDDRGGGFGVGQWILAVGALIAIPPWTVHLGRCRCLNVLSGQQEPG